MTRLAIALALAGLAAASLAQEPSGFEQELEARAWALGGGNDEALRSALASRDWTTRLRALDALGRTPLARARATRDFKDAVEAGLADPRPEVRAAAVRALVGGAPEPGPLERLAPTLAIGAAPAVAEALATRGVRLERVAPLELATEWGDEFAALSMSELESAYRPLLMDPEVAAETRIRLRLSMIAAGVELDVAQQRRAVEDWFDPDATVEERELRLRAARAGGDGLGRLLLERALEAEDPAERLALLDGAAEALDPATVFRLPIDGDEDALILLFEALRTRDLGLTPADFDAHGRELARFADVGSPDVKRAVLDLTSTLPARVAAPFLLAVLEGQEPAFAAESFTGIARGPLAERYQAALHAAWLRCATEQRQAWLRELPRRARLSAFRDDLLALVAVEPRAEIVELLAPLEDDPAVSSGLGDAFVLEVESIVAATELAERLEHDGRAVAVLGAWTSIEPGLLEDALRRTMHLVHPPDVKTRAKLPKAIVARLGAKLATAESRVSSARLLAALLREEGTPRRVRTEAAIVLASAFGIVQRHFDDLDGLLLDSLLEASRTSEPVLATRAIRALSGLAVSSGLPANIRTRLAWEALEDSGPRRAALELLVSHAPDASGELLELAFGRGNDRSAVIVIEAAAESGFATESDVRDLESILDFGRLEALEPSSRRVRRDALLMGLARRAGELPQAALDEVLREPIAAAEADHAALLTGHDPGAPDFRFSGELALAARLAKERRFGALLERTGGWWGIEPRTLVTLAERVGRDEPSAAARLAEAAFAGFAGLPLSGGGAGPGIGIQPRMRRVLRTQALFAALSTSVAAGHHADAARWADELAVGLVLESTPYRRLDERALEAALGARDPRRRTDPRARIEAARRQLRAAAALDAGDAERARTWLRAAEGWAPRSTAAAAFQARLERRAAR